MENQSRVSDDDRRQFESAFQNVLLASKRVLIATSAPHAGRAAWADAMEHYQRARLEWLNCELRLRRAGLLDPTRGIAVATPVVVLGDDSFVTASLALLLKVHGCRSTASYTLSVPQPLAQEPDRSPGQIAVIDVRLRELDAVAASVDRLRASGGELCAIAIAPEDCQRDCACIVDTVLGRPLKFDALIDAIVTAERRLQPS